MEARASAPSPLEPVISEREAYIASYITSFDTMTCSQSIDNKQTKSALTQTGIKPHTLRARLAKLKRGCSNVVAKVKQKQDGSQISHKARKKPNLSREMSWNDFSFRTNDVPFYL